jgi:ribA/ribD-fused uncharacterized protein
MEMTMIREFEGAFRFLSNFWPAEVELDGVTYASVEHAYQAAKVADPAVRAQIGAMTPGAAKRFVRRFPLPHDWATALVPLMGRLVRDKFTRHAELAAQLCATGERPLEEGNRWGDSFWGVDLRTGQGDNRLGGILMRVRAELASRARGAAGAHRPAAATPPTSRRPAVRPMPPLH